MWELALTLHCHYKIKLSRKNPNRALNYSKVVPVQVLSKVRSHLSIITTSMIMAVKHALLHCVVFIKRFDMI